MDHVFSPSFELAKYRTQSPTEKLGHCDIALRLFFGGRCDGPARPQGVAGIDQPAFDTAVGLGVLYISRRNHGRAIDQRER
jgi:hypothetical protein